MLENVKRGIGFTLMVMFVAMGFAVATPQMSEAASYTTYGTSTMQVANTKETKNEEVKRYTAETNGLKTLGQDSMEMVWGKYANSNVVAQLRNDEANVVTLDGIEGKVCQYGAQSKGDFVELLVDYTDQMMYVIVDSTKAQRGFQYSLLEVQNKMNMQNVQWDLELRNVDETAFTEEELTVLRQYVKGDTFYAVQVLRHYRRIENTGFGNPAAPQQQVIVSNGTSKFTDTINGINQVLSVPSMIDAAKGSLERLGLKFW